ncbi:MULTISPECIES: thiol reductant ABC exporter subunit CydC [Staphylococcus]|jgi:ATP-binding cassette subfamily C protein CydC|uniref:ABC transporter ATPase n=1 Tax=Staphylococcus nepalensis TaxID=214473 RepID=A0A2T4SCC9_9STAP|nr:MULTISPECIES: thiol reductant ABC exporter subunit CydC [Staphylococcus]VDG67862.1 ATP-binding/permease protein CydC [Lacrimispora indolis]MBO1222217.1 thiol reductant ABC exporter subunit CydC [Staphylococcus nepalensis]MCD8890544.1 thiol reductant ABC exporter subunit CydC [Staphylococcus nepalensis]MDR5648714.1 thiol reductant ABC exporter subunit CydC [Staphylococcus nepalensis]MDW8553368.1 thiol reductant ABC exporter subunit CydC [Staphylococcus nepalensis]
MRPRIQFKLDKDLILSIIVGVLGSLTALGMFFLSGYMVTQSALGAPLFALMILIVTVKFFGFLRAVARYIERLLSHKTTFTMLRNVRVQFFKRIIPVVPDVYRKFNSSDLLGRMVGSVESLQNIYLRVYYPPVVIGLTALIAMIVTFYFSYVHAIIIFLSMLITLVLIPWLSAKKAQTLKKRVNHVQGQFLNQFYDYKEGYEELERFQQTALYEQRVLNQLGKYEQAQAKEQRFLSLYEFSLNVVSMIALFATLSLGVIQVQNHQLDVVYLTSIVLMMLTLFEQAIPMSNVAYYKADTDEALSNINEVIAHPMKQGDEQLELTATSNKPLLEVQNVNFKYWNQSTYTLQAVQLNIHEGEHVAVIGPSGSGKSTLLQLMLGLYQSDNGAILINQQDVTNILDSNKYDAINALLQTQQLFDGKVRDNLFTDEEDEVIKEVFDILGLTHIDLDRNITLSGNTLSGGEIQRLGIARLLLKEAPIWILDEPTTALDIYHTNLVMEEIHKQAQTLIVATHDLRLLPKFDKIAVMVDGEIIEYGDYQSLLANKGYLYQMVTINQL